MKNALIYAVVLIGFALMVIAPYEFTWFLIACAVGAGVNEWAKNYRA